MLSGEEEKGSEGSGGKKREGEGVCRGPRLPVFSSPPASGRIINTPTHTTPSPPLPPTSTTPTHPLIRRPFRSYQPHSDIHTRTFLPRCYFIHPHCALATLSNHTHTYTPTPTHCLPRRYCFHLHATPTPPHPHVSSYFDFIRSCLTHTSTPSCYPPCSHTRPSVGHFPRKTFSP